MAGLNVLLGAWLFLTPFFVAMQTIPFWNAIIVGVLIAVLGAVNFARAAGDRPASTGVATANLLLGLWAVITPFVFVMGGTALWTHIIVGVLVAVFAAVNIYQAQQSARPARV